MQKSWEIIDANGDVVNADGSKDQSSVASHRIGLVDHGSLHIQEICDTSQRGETSLNRSQLGIDLTPGVTHLLKDIQVVDERAQRRHTTYDT